MSLTEKKPKTKTARQAAANPADSRPEGPGEALLETEPVEGVLPILPLHGVVLYPYTMTSLTLKDPASIALAEDAVTSKRLVAFVPCMSRQTPETQEDFYQYGCVGRIVKMLRFPDDCIRILVRGICRMRLDSLEETQPYSQGHVTSLQAESVGREDLEVEALARTAMAQFQEIINLAPNLPEELRVALLNLNDYGRLADLIADTINLSLEEKLLVLSTVDIGERLALVTTCLSREGEVLKLGHEIQSRVASAFASQQREHYLREQLRAIQEQLGEETQSPDIAELRERLEAATLTKAAREAAEHELKRLARMHPSASDYNVSRTYIETLLDMPWQTYSQDILKIRRARRVLDRDHYGLEKVKERILEHLAVMQLKPDKKSPILCLVGPPGVGKTSLGRSIARAMGRQFIRMSLGGVRDEAEIRGHRRTYVGALPGRIIQSIRRAKTANPVLMLDEIDKLGNDFRGDPASALLEVLDPQQNNTFADHYLDVPFDLSKVFFITTANLLDPIPSALLDRMEVIRLPGYTHNEKRQIARRYLLPRQLEDNGLEPTQLTVNANGLDTIISHYTAEAGVRNLERELGSVCRKFARKLVEAQIPGEAKTVLKGTDIATYLGAPRRFQEMAAKQQQVGIVTGLAWTAAGGEILEIEANRVPGSGKLTLTGSLGDVMKESAQIAFSFVSSRRDQFGIASEDLAQYDFHIHVPAGATPKDGPSAGAAIATALTSLLTGRPVLPGQAMTGELSLRGRVLPVGGIKEKVLAAVRAGVHTVVLPEKNGGDLDEVPQEVLGKLTFVKVSEATAALDQMLAPER